MRHDPSVPLTDFAPRHFSPAMKAWMPADPVAYVDGLNWYNAPPDNPINKVNPLGE
jgi:RHS repeat-associated protein